MRNRKWVKATGYRGVWLGSLSELFPGGGPKKYGLYFLGCRRQSKPAERDFTIAEFAPRGAGRCLSELKGRFCLLGLNRRPGKNGG